MPDNVFLNTKQLMDFVPHRYPFLLIDYVKELDVEKKYIKCIKNVTINEEFFIGHFPGNPVMPGVLMIEACAQAAIILFEHIATEYDGTFFLAELGNVKFKKMVTPGDVLEIESFNIQMRHPLYKGNMTAKVNGEIALQIDDIKAFKK